MIMLITAAVQVIRERFDSHGKRIRISSLRHIRTNNAVE